MRKSITIERLINAPTSRVFKALITPSELLLWHHAGNGWKTPYAAVDAKVGGKIHIGYSNADDTESFEFAGVISEINEPSRLAYYLQIEDPIATNNRLVTYDLIDNNGSTNIRVEIDLEEVNNIELQRDGWMQHYDHLQKLLEDKQDVKNNTLPMV